MKKEISLEQSTDNSKSGLLLTLSFTTIFGELIGLMYGDLVLLVKIQCNFAGGTDLGG